MPHVAVQLQDTRRQGPLPRLRQARGSRTSNRHAPEARTEAPNLGQAEREAWATINAARDELEKITVLEGDLTGFHKPKMSPAQKEALEKGRAHIARKAKPGLTRLRAIEAARWQNGWVPVVMRLAEEGLEDAAQSDIDRQLYRYTRIGSALNKCWKHGVPGYEGLFDASTRSMEPPIFCLAVTIIRIRAQGPSALPS